MNFCYVKLWKVDMIRLFESSPKVFSEAFPHVNSIWTWPALAFLVHLAPVELSFLFMFAFKLFRIHYLHAYFIQSRPMWKQIYHIIESLHEMAIVHAISTIPSVRTFLTL